MNDMATPAGRTRRRMSWWDVPALARDIDARIEAACAPDAEGAAAPPADGPTPAPGMPAALARVLGGERLGHGVSIACGIGGKEMALMRAGLVERFSLFEVWEPSLRRAREIAGREGLEDRIETHLGDAFAAEHPVYDLVYWDHALHHMMDVDAAVAWSAAALRPGGILAINDYVGATRLQWPWRETRLARAALAELEAATGERARPLRHRTLLDRWRQHWRDPSEAPQSDRILEACRRHCGGWAPRPVGGAVMNITGPHAAALQGVDDAAHVLIAHDQAALEAGVYHFSAGIWRKPG